MLMMAATIGIFALCGWYKITEFSFRGNNPGFPDKVEKNFILHDSHAKRQRYELHGLQDVNAFIWNIYFDIRHKLVLELFGRSLGELSDAEISVITGAVPMNVCEAEPECASTPAIKGLTGAT